MKRLWNQRGLEKQWTLSTHERELAVGQTQKRDANRLGFALPLRLFEIEGRFPRTRADIPPQVVTFVA